MVAAFTARRCCIKVQPGTCEAKESLLENLLSEAINGGVSRFRYIAKTFQRTCVLVSKPQGAMCLARYQEIADIGLDLHSLPP